MARITAASSIAKRKASRRTRRLEQQLTEVKKELKFEKGKMFEKAKPSLPVKQLARIAKRKISRIKGPTPKKRVAPKKIRLRTIQLISRVGQPRPFYAVEPLERKSYLRSVSSTWLATIGFLYNGSNIGTGTFTTQSGRQYKIYNFPFKVFEEWYYASSKGTYFNEFIRDQYDKDIILKKRGN